MPSLQDLPIIDAHQHLWSSAGIERLMYKDHDFGYRAVGIAALSLDQSGTTRNADGMLMKALYPDEVYLWGGLQYRLSGCEPAQVNLVEQAKSLLAAGCDGIKMLEGKPTIRRQLGLAMDAPNLMDFYEFMQAGGKPILCHVGDPHDFWDPKRCPEWAKRDGQLYDSRFVTLGQLREETERILRRFPRLKIIFAHFYFLAGEPDAARRFLQEHPTVCLDLTPGTEQYPLFAQNVATWQNFFFEYQDRIVFGTDLTEGDSEEDRPRMEMVRKFLELDEPFDYYHLKCHGLGLPTSVLDRIYSGNFTRLVSPEPAGLNLDLCVAHCDHVAEQAVRIADDKLRQKVLAELASTARKLQEMRIAKK
jgi:predicted TIM-barrel fold metal-dependent hydrolase